MARRVKDGYECGYCGKFYTSPVDADKCKEDHKLVYVPFSKEDLDKLISFIYTKEDAFLEDRTVMMLKDYLKVSYMNSLRKDE